MSEQIKDDGGPAFPVHGGALNENRDRFDDPRNQIIGGGMSLRDWFATHAPECPAWFTPKMPKKPALPFFFRGLHR